MENWQYHDNKLKELKKVYNKVSKQTQNRLQEIFDTFHFSFKNLYNIADIKTKNRVNTYIEEWKEKGLLTEYFGMLANNIYRRTQVKNSEILELLIYGAYIEEQSKLNKTELNIIKDIANYYYIQGQEEVNNTLPNKKRKKVSVISDAIFLALLDMPNAKGYIWKQYIEAIIKYNAEQVYRQVTIDLQQQKELDITNNVYQNIINKQNNSKLNINNNKISGDIDLTILGINNQAKIKGIQTIDNNGKVVFLANLDGTETPMCHSLNNQEFYINKENIFDRYYGETPKLLRVRRIKCFGLVLGLNLPPINYHFHWCRSMVQYIPPVEKQEKTEYNLDIPKISKEIKQVLNGTKLNSDTKKLFNKYLTQDNTEINYKLNVPMKYSINDDKIYINTNHPDIKYYDLSESLTHEIIHMIDIRNKISDRLNIENELRRTKLQIDIDEDKYINILSSSKYEDNMTLSDIFSAITNGRISGNYMHSIKYWIEDTTRVEKELSANIMSAYLNKNQDTLNIINSIKGLKEIKEKVVKLYNDYTR